MILHKLYQPIAPSLFSRTSVARSPSVRDTTPARPWWQPLKMLSDIILWWVYWKKWTLRSGWCRPCCQDSSMEFMTNLGETKLVRTVNSYRGCNEIYWLVSVHFNKQSYSEHSQTRDKEVETIIKDQLITEYEFYNYLKRRLASQAKALSVQWCCDLFIKWWCLTNGK